jgi:hypothetical protein
VAARIGRTLTADEETRLDVILADVSATIRAYTGMSFESGEVTQRLRVRNGKVKMHGPVTEVATVEDMNGNTVTFTWYLGDTIDLATTPLNIWELEPYSGGGLTAVDVTYTHGHDGVPQVIEALACNMAMRVLGTSPESGGMAQEAIDDYSYRVGTIGASGPVGLMPDEKAILDRFLAPVGVVWA